MHKLRFLLDADMPRSSAELIRSLGYDVEDVRDVGLGGAKDEEIVEYALRDRRVIITRNLGFGSTLRHPKHPGALIVRLPNKSTSGVINERLKGFLAFVDEDRIKNSIIVLEPSRFRRRIL